MHSKNGQTVIDGGAVVKRRLGLLPGGCSQDEGVGSVSDQNFEIGRAKHCVPVPEPLRSAFRGVPRWWGYSRFEN